MGGLKVIDPATKKVEAIIEKIDFFHSLLGEMKPQYLNDVVKGGHLPILELRGALFEIGEIKKFDNGFFDMIVKRGSNRKNNTYYSLGTTVKDTFIMIEEGLENVEKIMNITDPGRTDKILYQIESFNNRILKLCIGGNEATFFPFVDKGL